MVSVYVGLAPVLLVWCMEFCLNCLSIELPTALHWKLFPYTRAGPEKPVSSVQCESWCVVLEQLSCVLMQFKVLYKWILQKIGSGQTGVTNFQKVNVYLK